jgi:hypothetical protein
LVPCESVLLKLPEASGDGFILLPLFFDLLSPARIDDNGRAHAGCCQVQVVLTLVEKHPALASTRYAASERDLDLLVALGFPPLLKGLLRHEFVPVW